MKYIVTALTIVLMITACGQKSPHENVKMADIVLADKSNGYSAKSNYSPIVNSSPALLTDTSKKIIKNGEISFETANLNDTRNKIIRSLNKLGGYVAEENETNNGDDNRRELVLKLRIPSKNFDLLLDSVSSNAVKIDSKNISVKDVTTEFIDIKTQLANKRILENTYLDLLKKAGKIGDVLQIESKLTDIRTTIDSTQGELNYLSKQVAYSSLVITFYTKQVQQDKSKGIGYKFVAAIADGWQILQNLFFGLITLWPIILLIAILYVFINRWRKRNPKVKP